MTAFLPDEVKQVFDRFITAELTVVGARGQPITWPVTPYYHSGDECIDVTTGLGYPQKADLARANPKVSLLFSEPSGSGLSKAPAVFVQGTASVDDHDLRANRERYERESIAKLPATKKLQPPRALKPLFDWYYTRIYIHVRPERVFVWPEGDATAEPQLFDSHMEEVRSGHDEQPEVNHVAPAGAAAVWNERLAELGERYKSAVVSLIAPDGFPFSVRVAVHCDRSARRIRIDSEPVAAPLEAGLVCLTAHEHDPEFRWQRNFQVRGDLVLDEVGWSVVPRKLIGGFELPSSSRLAVYARNLVKAIRFTRTARREYRRRASG